MKVFVSYSRDSEPIAKLVVADLESLGHDVWFDRELSGGQAWWEQILAAIRDCGLLVFLLHPQSLASVACLRERAYALALGKPILPVRVADGISVNLLPPELAQRQIIPYRSGDRAEVLALARAVAAVPPAPALPSPLPEPPEVPASYLGGLALRIDGSAALSYQDQSALLVDLRKALREADSRVDADILLGRLRKRHDLFAAIAEEIDALRERTQPPPVRRPAAPPPADAAPPTPPPPPSPLHRHALGPFTAAGAGIGLLTAVIYVAERSGRFGEGALIIGLTAGAGLIAGAIAARDLFSQRLALGAALLGGAAGMMIASGTNNWYVIAVVYGLGPGAIAGAAIGRLWRRFRPG